MYKPKQIVFAPTAECNLACPHCRVDRRRGQTGNQLSAEAAIAFLDSCQNHEIDRVGFSGGEPFLRPDFLEAVCAASVERGLYFDRLMTNAVWSESETELRDTLQRLYDAGYDGTIAISVDDYHAQTPASLALFIRTVFAVWKRADCIEQVSVLGKDGTCSLTLFEAVAAELSAQVKIEAGMPLAIQDSRYLENLRKGMEDGSGLYIPIMLMPYSAAAGDPSAWQAKRWFRDDYCEGPGQIFYVHPDGAVAVCCGFANENPQLIIGDVRDGYERLMESAAANPQVRICYESGLGKKRQELEAAGVSFPGKTDDICFFCDYVCRLPPKT